MKYGEPHVDGHILICRDGTIKWLTLLERILLILGIKNAKSLDKTKKIN